MGIGTLTIYNASAGSGKTHKLAGIYLEKLFRSRYSYRRILAVTFTHKATAEMKDRILEELNKLATGSESSYLSELLDYTGKSEEAIRKEAAEILYSILHDYSRFSVSTIDSFYQKIIRAFARDMGLHSGFNVQIDNTLLLASAVDRMIDSASSDNSIRGWLSMFANSNIEDGKSWDLRKNILGLADELFKEKFKLISVEERTKLKDKVFLKSFIDEMRSLLVNLKKELRDLGSKCMKFYDDFALTDSMFYQKGKGVPGFLRSIYEGEFKSPSSYVMAALSDPPKWSSGPVSVQLERALNAGLADAVQEAVRFCDSNISSYKTAREIVSNIYILGILSDVLGYVRSKTKDENIFLLSDAGELIYLITSQDQAPFIYEKVGNTFENYMIDEFQDTSVIQWKNFSKLIDESMSSGHDNLVVGDIKQSIYRWRNSDWKTLDDLNRQADNVRFVPRQLNTNWRSRSNIIAVNNSLFTVIPHILDEENSGNNRHFSFRKLYSEAFQEDTGLKKDGYVRVEFIQDTEELTWKESVLKKIPLVIEQIQDNGYGASDIGILVRDNKEGADVLNEIIEYSRSCPEEKKKKYTYSVVSSESLLLVNSPVINFLISALMVLDNPDNMIGRALMLRNFHLSEGNEGAGEISLESSNLMELSSATFPSGYNDFLLGLRYLPLWNITESVIGFFGLGKHSSNVAYLNAFQDLVISQMALGNPGIRSFLDWWESEGVKKSVLLPDQQNSVKILTIHKSKGLEFGVVILPFLSWNLDHKTLFSNIMWVTPESAPFNKLGILPVRYKSSLEDTIFAEQYLAEKYSAYLDNLNLLYVAFTRAIHAVFGFAPDSSNRNTIPSILKRSLTFDKEIHGFRDVFLFRYFNGEAKIFEYGMIPDAQGKKGSPPGFEAAGYQVNDNNEAIRLRLHWEDYIDGSGKGRYARLSHGKIMHEIFSDIKTIADVQKAVRKRVIEGKIPESEESGLCESIKLLLRKDNIIEWFEPGNEVLNEASILMPDSSFKRPDRVIVRDGKTVIIDFKFGQEDQGYINQVRKYKKVLTEMDYIVEAAYIWYVDNDKIVPV